MPDAADIFNLPGVIPGTFQPIPDPPSTTTGRTDGPSSDGEKPKGPSQTPTPGTPPPTTTGTGTITSAAAGNTGVSVVPG